MFLVDCFRYTKYIFFSNPRIRADTAAINGQSARDFSSMLCRRGNTVEPIRTSIAMLRLFSMRAVIDSLG